MLKNVVTVASGSSELLNIFDPVSYFKVYQVLKMTLK